MDFVPQLQGPQSYFLESKEYIVNTKLYFLRDVLRRDWATRVEYANTQEQLPETYVCDIEWHDPELAHEFHNLKTVTWHHNNEKSFLDKCLGVLFASPAFCKVLGATVEALQDTIISFTGAQEKLPSMDFDEDNRAKFRLLQCMHFAFKDSSWCGGTRPYLWYDKDKKASFGNISLVRVTKPQAKRSENNLMRIMKEDKEDNPKRVLRALRALMWFILDQNWQRWNIVKHIDEANNQIQWEFRKPASSQQPASDQQPASYARSLQVDERAALRAHVKAAYPVLEPRGVASSGKPDYAQVLLSQPLPSQKQQPFAYEEPQPLAYEEPQPLLYEEQQPQSAKPQGVLWYDELFDREPVPAHEEIFEFYDPDGLQNHYAWWSANE